MMEDIDIIPILNRHIGLNYSCTMSSEEKVNYLVQNLRLTVHNFKNLANYTNSSCLDMKWTPFKKNNYDIKKDTLIGDGKALTELLIRLHSEKRGITFEEVDISTLAKLYSKENVDIKESLQNKQFGELL